MARPKLVVPLMVALLNIQSKFKLKRFTICLSKPQRII